VSGAQEPRRNETEAALRHPGGPAVAVAARTEDTAPARRRGGRLRARVEAARSCRGPVVWRHARAVRAVGHVGARTEGGVTVDTTPVRSAEPAGPGIVVTESAYRLVRAARGECAPVGDASAWDLFRMAFASVAPPGAHRLSAAERGCGSP